MPIQTRWLNQPEQVWYRARLPLTSEEGLSIPSTIPMVHSTTPDVPFVHIRLARRCHGWTVLASSSPTDFTPPFQVRRIPTAGACYVFRPARRVKGVLPSIRQDIGMAPSRKPILDPVSIASGDCACLTRRARLVP